MADLPYRCVVSVSRAALRAMRWTPEVSGREHLPASGAAVIACNHVGFLDPFFLGYAALPRLIRYLGTGAIFDRPFVGPLVRGMGHIPVRSSTGAPSPVVAAAIEHLARGEVVGLFPEGFVNPSFVPSRGRTGAARIAAASGAPLVPAAVWGPQRIITRWQRPNIRRGIPMMVRFGAPVPVAADDDPVEVTARLMTAISELAGSLQDDYPEHPDGAWWIPAHRGGGAPTPAEVEERLRRH